MLAVDGPDRMSTPAPRPRVLVVEDEQKVANALRQGLEGEQYDVAVEQTGEGAFFRLNTEIFDVILLEYLLRHQGQTVSRGTLARDVWKEPARSTSLDNVIDVHIARLRRKVDLEHLVKLIHTVRGVGFMVREGEP